MKTAIAAWLRRTASRLDPDNAPTPTGYSYTHERRGPRDTHLVWRDDGRGCPVWYIGDADLNRSFTEADTDWRPAKERLADTFERFGTSLNEAMQNTLKAERQEKP